MDGDEVQITQRKNIFKILTAIKKAKQKIKTRLIFLLKFKSALLSNMQQTHDMQPITFL